MILPLTSDATSTLVCGRTCPLAVTDDTRSRFCTGSMRTSTALLPRLAALKASMVPTATIAMIPIAHLGLLFMKCSASAERAANRTFECGERFVIFVNRVDSVALGLLVRAADGRDNEERLGAYLGALLSERNLLRCLVRVLLLQLDCLRVGNKG